MFGADHVFRMDAMQMIDQHVASGTGVTVAALPVPREEATAFGVIKTAKDGRTIEAFLEKPADPPARPGHPDEAFASMGNYVFTSDVLVDALRKDAERQRQPARHGPRHHPDAGAGAPGRGL